MYSSQTFRFEMTELPHFSEVEDWTPAANIYALLKTKSRNTYKKDRNPRPRITVHDTSSREYGSKSIRNKAQEEPSSGNKTSNLSTASCGSPDTHNKMSCQTGMF